MLSLLICSSNTSRDAKASVPIHHHHHQSKSYAVGWKASFSLRAAFGLLLLRLFCRLPLTFLPVLRPRLGIEHDGVIFVGAIKDPRHRGCCPQRWCRRPYHSESRCPRGRFEPSKLGPVDLYLKQLHVLFGVYGDGRVFTWPWFLADAIARMKSRIWSLELRPEVGLIRILISCTFVKTSFLAQISVPIHERQGWEEERGREGESKVSQVHDEERRPRRASIRARQ